jgi:hypothetical protein
MIQLDLNSPVFQQTLFTLGQSEQLAVLKTLHKISRLTWEQVYRDKGLHWELIHSRKGPNQTKLYSLRISQKCRAVAYREQAWMRLLSLHPDHNSAY